VKKTNENIPIEDRKIEDTFTLPGDNRVFKVIGLEKTGQQAAFKFCVYALASEAEDEGMLRWRLDYENAKALIVHYNLVVEYARIAHTPTDNIYLSQEMRKETGCFRNVGIRYIAEAAIRNGTTVVVRTASAGADNVSWDYMTWAPDIACKRAIIKCVIDSLDLPKIDPDIAPAKMKVEDTAPSVGVADEQVGADKDQIAAIKALLKKTKRTLPDVAKVLKLDVKTIMKLVAADAEKIIKELQK